MKFEEITDHLKDWDKQEVRDDIFKAFNKKMNIIDRRLFIKDPEGLDYSKVIVNHIIDHFDLNDLEIIKAGFLTGEMIDLIAYYFRRLIISWELRETFVPLIMKEFEYEAKVKAKADAKKAKRARARKKKAKK